MMAPNGSEFLDFSAPSVHAGDVAFVGDTGVGACVFVFRSKTGAIEPIACYDQQIEGLGTIELLPMDRPVILRGRVVFRVRFSGGVVTNCIVRERRGRIERLACEGDPLPGGFCFDGFDRFAPGSPFAATARHLVSFANASNGASIRLGLFGFTDRSIIEIADSGVTAPFDFANRLEDYVLSLQRKRLLFDADLRGPGGRAAILDVTLPR
jgi:hypothetical protein